MTRTPEAKRVKTIYMYYSQMTDAAGAVWHRAADQHVFQEDVRLIGFWLGAEAHTETGHWADGYVETICELSRVAIERSDGALADLWALLDSKSVALDTNIAGRPFVNASVMFPEGYGVDFDDGEAIYLNCLTDCAGWGVGEGVHITEVILYVVER